MYGSPTTALASDHEPSEVFRDYARQLRVQADIIDSILQRLRTAEDLGWESPAGRRFRAVLQNRTAALTGTAALLREAAVSMDSCASALQLAPNGSRI